MNSKHFMASIALLAWTACGFETHPETVAITTVTGEQVRLVGGEDEDLIHEEETEVEILVLEVVPDGIRDWQADGRNELITFRHEGRYVFDRWIHHNLTSTWTHRYTVDVANSNPVAVVEVVGWPHRAGTAVSMHGRNSYDGGEDELEFQWALVQRPEGSTASFDAPQSVATNLLPDLPGLYVVELDVFDGKLWAKHTARVDINVISE